MSAAERGKAAARTKARRICPSMLTLCEAFQAEHLNEGNIEVYRPDPADRAPHVHVVPEAMPFGEQGGKVVALPCLGPWENQQKETDFQAKRDEQDRRHLVIPAVRLRLRDLRFLGRHHVAPAVSNRSSCGL